MKTNKNKNNIPGPRWSLLTLLLVFGTLVGMVSCDDEDDIPPPSAYVPPTPEPEPEPGEPCNFTTAVPVLPEGIDFECEGPEVTYFGDKEGSPLVLEFVENPDASGINTSEKVAQITQSPGVEGWAGFFFDLSAKVDFSELHAINLKVYAPAADQAVLVKLEDSASGGTIAKEVQALTTKANEWEELSFVFSPSDTDKFDRLVLFFNFNGDKGAETVHYFDDIVQGDGTAVEPTDPGTPSGAAPAPSVDPLEVISLFSGAYTDIPVDTWRTEWSNATLEEVAIDGDDVKKYSALGFVGIETMASPVDISGMTHFHVDIWTGDATAFNIKLVDLGGDGAFGGGDDVEHEIAIENPTQQEWVGLDLPISDFVNLTTREHIGQLIFSAAPFAATTVYVDNVYFYNESGVSTRPLTGAPAPTLGQAQVISIFSDTYTSVEGTDFNPNWGQATQVSQEDVAGNNTLVYENLNYQGTAFAAPIDVSAMTMVHVDYWTPDATALNLSLISPGPAETPYAFTITTGQWTGVDIPLSAFSSVVDLSDLIQLKFDGNGTIYLDNIYFFAPPATEPTAAAASPTHAEADVISLFSEAYTDVPVDTWRTDWSGGDLEEVSIAGNAVKKYTNLNFVGIETVNNQIDASAMTHFRTDIWTADATQIRIKLVDFGPNGIYDGPGSGDDTEHEYVMENPAQNTWLSLDIPLTEFAGLTNRGNIAQLIYAGQPVGSATLFVDNVYFHK